MGTIMNNFKNLSTSIRMVHETLRAAVLYSANKALTIRNWLIGCYIVEYEQNGKDRAKYGQNLIQKLSEKMDDKKGFSPRNLRSFREFYASNPHLGRAIEDELVKTMGISGFSNSKTKGKKRTQIWQSPTAKSLVANGKLNHRFPSPKDLIHHFSFTHFVELMRICDHQKRLFYEIQGIKGNWSVTQLKRQIESLLYERTGLSINKKGLIEYSQTANPSFGINDIIRDPYILEFTGFPEIYQFSENDLESSLLDHIQNFLLELGNGFCFEARQKRITLDNEHDRIDLVFYHRTLSCHVLIDLKVRKFTAEDVGQMNFYLNYYRENMMVEGDNPPVGLILCTDRDETRVRYATTGLDNTIFVSRYLTKLPSEKQLQEFLTADRERTILKLQEQQAKYGD